MNTYSIIYDKYDRGPSTTVSAKFEAPNDKAALLIAHPCVSWGCGKFDINDLDDEDLANLKNETKEGLVQSITYHNGDGCDALLCLKNETTGETLYEEDYYTEDPNIAESWDESEFGDLI